MKVRTQCRECGLPFRGVIAPGGALGCPGCGHERPVASEDWSDDPPRRVDECPLCGCRHLYRQRDFNRALGCGLVLLGAVLVPWTYGLSLLVLSLVDVALYYRLPHAVVCYRCDTVFRGAPPNARQTDFDLLKHDVLKYGKSWGTVEGLGD